MTNIGINIQDILLRFHNEEAAFKHFYDQAVAAKDPES